MPNLRFTLLVGLACAACDGSPTSSRPDASARDGGTPRDAGALDDAGTPRDAGVDIGADAGTPRDGGPRPEVFEPVVIAGCDGVDAVDRDCEYTRFYDAQRCHPDQPCDDLVIFFAGGGMPCEDATHPQHTVHLRPYVDDGYVTVSACVFPDFADAQWLPFSSETERVDRLVNTISTWARGPDGPWTGANLLLSGTSHGGAALMHALADGRGYDEAGWAANGTTAVCTIDVPIDIPSREAAYQTDLADCRGTRNRNICNRYGVRMSGGETTCGNATAMPDCPALTPPLHPSCQAFVDADSMGDTDVTTLSFADYHFVSCTGRDFENPCTAGIPDDGPPELGMASLCDRIDAAADKACSLESHAGMSHGDCVTRAGPTGGCKRFFEAL